MSDQSISIDVKIICCNEGSARAASREIGRAETAVKDKALNVMADRIDAEAEKLKQANALDLQAGKAKGLDDALLDRLALTDAAGLCQKSGNDCTLRSRRFQYVPGKK